MLRMPVCILPPRGTAFVINRLATGGFVNELPVTRAQGGVIPIMAISDRL